SCPAPLVDSMSESPVKVDRDSLCRPRRRLGTTAGGATIGRLAERRPILTSVIILGTPRRKDDHFPRETWAIDPVFGSISSTDTNWEKMTMGGGLRRRRT